MVRACSCATFVAFGACNLSACNTLGEQLAFCLAPLTADLFCLNSLAGLQVGNVLIGSDHNLVLQTMTTTDTRDVEGSVAQIKKCADAGADMVRLTVQGKKEAEACFKIRERLNQVRTSTYLHFVMCWSADALRHGVAKQLSD